jgi:hypothetical protein
MAVPTRTTGNAIARWQFTVPIRPYCHTHEANFQAGTSCGTAHCCEWHAPDSHREYTTQPGTVSLLEPILPTRGSSTALPASASVQLEVQRSDLWHDLQLGAGHLDWHASLLVY